MRAHAPGKLMLLGEYAVLRGAPALVTAVNRRAVVSQHAGEGIDAPQLGLYGADGSEQRLQMVVSLLDGPTPLHIDTGAFYVDGAKLGLGSSAAVAVAVAGFVRANRGEHLDPAAVFAAAYAAHQEAQGGGSGADIAASVYGGTLLYRMNDPPASVSWPADLSVQAVWTGESASTSQLVRSVLGPHQKKGGAVDAALTDMAAVSEAAATPTRAGDTAGLLDAFRDFAACFVRLSDACDGQLVTSAHRHWGEVVRSAGGVYKPSGAGGGDIGLAISRTEDAPRIRAALGDARVALEPNATGYDTD